MRQKFAILDIVYLKSEKEKGILKAYRVDMILYAKRDNTILYSLDETTGLFEGHQLISAKVTRTPVLKLVTTLKN